MKHVVAFDLSMEKSMMTVYNRYKCYEYEGKLERTRASFQLLYERLHQLTLLDGKEPEFVFESTGVYSKGLEKFYAIMGIGTRG
ncbi:hypothetical protein [Oceanobacillus jeddahense]|uniref:hypothetical protein n=1 Tax=Oceanobacillus jeddahense TaxID=1462527 RepID=UPI000AA376E7|nr:hypothetical protein [Oceanobacillus jeddahense]